MCTVLGQVQQSHLWFQRPQQLVFRCSLDFLCGRGTHYRFPSQVLAQHGHLRHSHWGKWGSPAPASCPSPYIPVAQGPAQTRPGPVAHRESRGEDAEDRGPGHGEDQGGGWTGGQQHISSKVGVRCHVRGRGPWLWRRSRNSTDSGKVEDMTRFPFSKPERQYPPS